jgi:hypothetical protein
MHHGLQLDLRGDYDSTAVVLERTPLLSIALVTARTCGSYVS